MRGARPLVATIAIALALGAATWGGATPLRAHTPEGAEAEVEAVLDGETIGDPITIFVRLTFAAGGRLVLPDLAQPLGGLERAVPELIESGVSEGDDPHGTAVVVLRTRAFVTGTVPVELPSLTLIDAAGGTTVVTLPSFELEIQSVLPDDLAGVALRPLKAAERIDGAPVALELVLGPILGAAALLLLTVVARRRLRQRRIVIPEPPPDPVAIATAELGAIGEAGLLPSRLEEFCRRVDLAVRHFLAERYALPATNLTATELTSQLARAGVEAGTIRRVRNLCAETDAVAYAGAAPTAERAVRYVELAQAIVQPPGAAVAASTGSPAGSPAGASAGASAGGGAVAAVRGTVPAANVLEAPAGEGESAPATRPADEEDGDRWSRPREGGGA